MWALCDDAPANWEGRPAASKGPESLSRSATVAWLADGSGLLVVALDEAASALQIWHISYPSGEVRKVTNDLNHYIRLSLTADSSTLVTVQTEVTSDVWIVPLADASRARQISSGRPSGKIVYASQGGGLDQTSDVILIRDFR